MRRSQAAQALFEAVDACTPDAVVMLGEAGGRARVTPERIAINVDDYAIPDNAGEQPRGTAIVAGGADGYFSTLPVAAMVDAVLDAGVPAAVSNSAGTYLCNHVFYRLMHRFQALAEPPRAGFVHLPYLHEQVRERPEPVASLSESSLVGAVGAALAAVARRRAAPRAG